MTDEELLKAAKEAHQNANNAPRQGDAWARWSNEWMQLEDEIKRRGLKNAP